MRHKVARRKSWKIGKRLAKKYPGLYKVVSDYGYGDGSTLGEGLDIASALVLYCEHRHSRASGPVYVSDLFSTASHQSIASAMYQARDRSANYYIVDDDEEMDWEAPDFDPYSS